jgi:adenylate cyclase
MSQFQSLQLNDFSWELVGSTIINSVGQSLDVDWVILWLQNREDNLDRYFIYQNRELSVLKIDENLLKLTASPQDRLEEIASIYQKYDIFSSFCLLLTDRTELFASLTLHRRGKEKLWQSKEARLAEILAIQSALTLDRVLACQSIQALAQREITISRITNVIRSSLESHVMFASIVTELGKALEVDGCTLSLWREEDKFVRCVGLYNPHEPELNLQNSPTGQPATSSIVAISENPILQQVIATKKPVLIEDLKRQREIAAHELPLHAKSRALLIIPLIFEAEIIGSITLRQAANARHWHQADIDLAEAVAQRAAEAISQVLTHEKVRALAQRETTINHITTAIRSSLEPRVMFASIVTELGKALEVDGCTLSLWREEDKFVQCVGLYNPQELASKILPLSNVPANNSIVAISENPILQQVIATKKPVLIEDLKRQREIAAHELPLHSKSRALLLVPLIFESEIIGSITLRQSAHTRRWNQSDIDLAEAVADQAAIAVQQAKLYETTRKQAEQLKISEQQVTDLNKYLTDSILKRFLPNAIADKAATGKLVLDLSPESHRITVLFCDLVNFTNLSEQLGTHLVAKLLNEYLEAMTQAVFERGGTVDKFIGDGIMALFGAPEQLSHREQAQKAIATAKSMYDYLDRLNQQWQAQGLRFQDNPLQMRCGIHQGRAVVGMFGGGQRKDYTAIGNVVNIAARLQEAARPNTILISQTVACCLDDLVVKEFQPLKLKGIKQNLLTHSIVI